MARSRWLWLNEERGAVKYEYIGLSGDTEDKDGIDTGPAQWKRRFFIISIVYAITLICGFIGFLYKLSIGWESDRRVPTNAIYGHIPIRPVLFQPNQTYKDVFPDRGEGAHNITVWDAITPAGGGFIAVANPRKYGLSGGFPLGVDSHGDIQEGYGISMFHQLHCLSTIRKTHHPESSQGNHISHCFEYLRQAIMCAGDTTLETPVVGDNGVLVPDVDGWGIVHQCKSWTTLFQLAESQSKGHV